jgi:hypothetical protein
MAKALSVSRAVNVTVNLSPKAAGRRSFGILCIAGDSDVIDGVERIRSYTGLDAVAAEFGLVAPEYLAADLYFGQSPRPKVVMIARWIRTAAPAILHGGTAEDDLAAWQAVTTGAMKLDVGGVTKSISSMDFSSVTAMTGVAAVIDAKLATNGAGCTWDGTRFVIKSTATGAAATLGYAQAPTSGADISAMAGLTQALAEAPAAGMDAETPAACAAVLADKSAEWYGLTFAASTMPTDSQAEDVAAFIEATSRSRVAGFTTQDVRVLSSSYTDDLPSKLKAKSYTRSVTQYSSSSPYAVASLLGRAFSVDYNGNKTTITLKFKQEPGVTAEALGESQANALEAKNCNVFVTYDNDTTIIEQGVVASGAYFDEVHGTDWLQNAIQTNCYNVLYQSQTKIPQTEAGVTQIMGGITQAMKQGVANGLIAPGTWFSDGFGTLQQGDYLPKGYYLYSQPIVDQAQADREARKAPPIQVAIKLAGAIHSVDITVNVNR